MPRTISPARVEAFFRALGETGNQSLAAERARVSRDWARWRGKHDPAFAARLQATVVAASERLRAARSVEPPAKWRAQAGEELIVKGGCGRRVQIARARLQQWTPRTEARFLGALAACCNVRAAARAVGLTPEAAYCHYRRWPDFAARWDAALEEGYVRLEMALFENADRAFEAVDYPPDMPIEPMSVDQALSLLKAHQAQVHKIGKRQGRPATYRRTAEEVFDSIARKLERVERRLREGKMPGRAGARRDLDRGGRIVRGR